jgi:hypothetical protein
VAGCDPLCSRDVNAGNLFPINATIVNKIIAGLAFIRKRPLRSVRLREVSNEAHRTIARLGELASRYRKLPVVVIDKDAIPANRIEPAILNGTLPGAFDKDGPAPVYGPIAKRWHIVSAHVGA